MNSHHSILCPYKFDFCIFNRIIRKNFPFIHIERYDFPFFIRKIVLEIINIKFYQFPFLKRNFNFIRFFWFLSTNVIKFFVIENRRFLYLIIFMFFFVSIFVWSKEFYEFKKLHSFGLEIFVFKHCIRKLKIIEHLVNCLVVVFNLFFLKKLLH